MAQTPINAANVLSKPIKDAYGKDTVVKTNIFGDINDEFNAEKEAKKTAYKSLTEVGNDLDAARYSQLEGGINSLLEKASNGSLKVGSSEWVKQTANLTASANQLAEISKIEKGLLKDAVAKPDQFVYMTQNGDGEVIETGIGGLTADMLALGEQKYESPQEYINEASKVLQKATMAPRSISAGYKDLADQAVVLNKKLLDEAETNPPSIKKVTLGSEVIEIATTLSDADTKEVVDAFANQFAPTIAWEYAQKKAKNQTPTKEDGTKMTAEEYVASQVKAYITKGKVKTEVRSRPAPRSDNDGKQLKYDGSGWSFGDYYGSVVTEMIPPDPKFGGDEREAVKEITVESYKTNPQQDFINEDGEAVRGSLVRIKRNDDGDIVLMLRSGKENPEAPLEDNFDVLRTEYGLTEAEIRSIFNQKPNSSTDRQSVIGGKSTEDPLGIL